MGNSDFGKVLRKMREDAKKTVPEVSEYLISSGYRAATQTIYGWERGLSQPNAELFLSICRFYKVTDVLSYFGDVPEISDIISIPEREVVKKYRSLDPYGKEAVDGVLNVEWRRCEEARFSVQRENRAEMEAVQEMSGKIIQLRFKVPGYSMPMSAGTGQEAGQEYAKDYTLVKEQPRGTSYIATVSGDSMEPTYYDGDRLFIRATVDIEPGQIGVFLMGGQQWIKELGDGVLISHNQKYDPIPMTDDIRCQGLVLGVCDESYFE